MINSLLRNVFEHRKIKFGIRARISNNAKGGNIDFLEK